MSEYKRVIAYPNQKVVITKKTNSDEQHIYSPDNIEAVLTAARVLTDRAFKLYVSMNLHQNGYTYGLSAVDVKNRIGFLEKKYRQAVSELIEAGYMVENPNVKHEFTFYEAPYIDNAMQPKRENYISQTGDDGFQTDCNPVQTDRGCASNGQDTQPKQGGHTARMGTHPLPNGQDTHPKQGREIIQDNTEDTTINNTWDNIRDNTNNNTWYKTIEDFAEIIGDGEVPF